MFGTSKSTLISKSSTKGRLMSSDYMRNYSNPTEASVANMASVEQNLDYRIDRSFMTDAYRVSPFIRSIVEITKNRFDQVELFPMPLSTKKDSKPSDYSSKIKKRMEDVVSLLMKPNDDYESFSSLKKKVIGDILVYDECGLQVRKGTRNDKNIPYELYGNVSGEELFVHTDKSGRLMTGSGKTTSAFLQIRSGKILDWWGKDIFLNFINNRRAGYANGFSPIESIADSILGDLEGMNYNLRFYQNNARPNIAFLFEQLGFGAGKGALERAEAWYNAKHKGQPHKPLFMGTQKGNIKIQELTMSNKDMEFNNWELFLVSRIMGVYGMQPMVMGILTDTTGKLNSESQGEQFKKNAIIPLVKMFTNTLNSVLVWGDDNYNYDDIYITSADLDIDDEKKQADIWEIFLRTGVVTINQIRDRLQMPPVSWGNEPFVPLNFSPLSILKKYQLSRIQSNMKNAMSPKIDNNAGGDSQKEQDDYMVSNYKVPSGVERIEPNEVIEAFTKIIDDKESRTKYVDMGVRNLKDSANSFGLSWQRIMQTR